jgi:hypothetical protein
MQSSFSFSPPPLPVVLGPAPRRRLAFPMYPTIAPRPASDYPRPSSSASGHMNGASSSSSAVTFRAPAHKHAHHLHTIPPREKSTRTLIIDHMLWAHGRTRFAQARAELGMTDRSGDPYSSRTGRRERPETFNEDDEMLSDGENTASLYARSGGPGHPHDEEEDQRLARQDLLHARSLRFRSEALEKVVVGMLNQPPQDIPFPEDEPVVPIAPERPSDPAPPPPAVHKHVLPNGVRVRLTLATVINDLFARQAPIPRRTTPPASTVAGSSMSSVSTPRSESADSPYAVAAPPFAIPPALLPLATISNAAQLVLGSIVRTHSILWSHNLMILPAVSPVSVAASSLVIRLPTPNTQRTHASHVCCRCRPLDRQRATVAPMRASPAYLLPNMRGWEGVRPDTSPRRGCGLGRPWPCSRAAGRRPHWVQGGIRRGKRARAPRIAG